MTITVQTRAIKGSPLTFNEMDSNFTSLGRDATQVQQGNVEIADQAETEALTDTVKAVCPEHLEAGVLAALANLSFDTSAIGHVTLPNGIIIQWGTEVSTSDTTEVFNLDISYPNSNLVVLTQVTTANLAYPLAVTAKTTSTFTLDRNNSVSGSETFYYISVGY